jgi:hypothetical protein
MSEENEKTSSMMSFCSLKNALSSDVLKVKFDFSFKTNALLIAKETE